MKKPHVAILGAGPAGLGAAWQLRKQGKARVTVLEQKEAVGGNAGSFELAGLNVDYGSHRLHPATEPNILRDLQGLLKNDLLDRPRHGRIRLKGRWIHFPLKPLDLIFRLPVSFAAGVAIDTAKKVVPSKNGNADTFTSVLQRGLGATICRDFYFPYAEKIWGLPANELSAIQARRRVAAGSLGKLARKALSLVPGLKSPGAGRFFYPKHGFGQISRAIADEALRLGADIRLDSPVSRIKLGEKQAVTFESGGTPETLEADFVWSTIPLTALARAVEPAAPPEVVEASRSLSYRAMVLIYLVLNQPRWTEFDAHYFPETEIKLTRLSEPKNYGASRDPKHLTVLCGELPCAIDDAVWTASDNDLGELVRESVEKCGLPIRSEILNVTTRRLPYAYPIYAQGYERYFEIQDEWANGLDNVLTFGRQGLFAHDNTHHALAMAYGAVDCLDNGTFDRSRWEQYRKEFAEHIVED